MEIRLSNANIVILAKNHNPAIVSADWLEKQEIFDEEPLRDKPVSTPVFSFIEFPSFQLLVEPIRLQIALKAPSEDNIPRLKKAVLNYVKALPETPYNAVGLNYTLIVELEDEYVASQLLGKLFISDQEIFSKGLGTEEYQIGGILVVSEDLFRLRLIVEKSAQSPKDISCNFNYHTAVDDLEKVKQAIDTFQNQYEKAKHIISQFFE